MVLEPDRGRSKQREGAKKGARTSKSRQQIRFVSDLKADYFRFATTGMADNQIDMLQNKFA